MTLVNSSGPTFLVLRPHDSRRALLAGTAGLAACGPKLAKRFDGYCFVANRGSRSLAVVNLTRFKVDRQIALPGAPSVVLTRPEKKSVIALLPDQGTVIEVAAGTMRVSARAQPAKQAIAMRPSSGSLWVLAKDPQALVPLDLGSWRCGQAVPLAHEAADFDISPDGSRAVVSYAGRNQCGMFDLTRGSALWNIQLSTEAGIPRFRPDGKQILIGSAAGRTITVADAGSGQVLTVLPIPFSPENFCFSTDNGGQMFATGPGMDAVGIVYPYQGELGETVLTGRQPGSMTVNDTLLFIANPAAGDVTVMAIAERQVIAKIESGSGPCAIALADEYALVLNRGSGDLAVVRLSKLTDLRYKRAPLFTVIAVGEDPVSAAVCRL